MSRDKMKQKLEELRSHADLSISALNISEDQTMESGGGQISDKLDVLKELQQKIIDMQTEEKKGLKKEELYGEVVQSPSNNVSTAFVQFLTYETCSHKISDKSSGN